MKHNIDQTVANILYKQYKGFDTNKKISAQINIIRKIKDSSKSQKVIDEAEKLETD